MTNRICLFTTAALLATACTGNRTEGTEGTTTCYTYATDNDGIMLRLNRRGNSVEGELTYILYEKDMNKGTISGVMEDDTLFADYTFTSEGTTSVREVAFVKRGNELVEAFGEVAEQDGKFIFRDRSLLTLNENVVLREAECGN